MYPKAILFGIGLYEIFIAVGMLLALFLADKLSVRRHFSVRLQRHLVICIACSIVVGFFGAVLFQATYHWIETGDFSLRSGMTFYGGLLFGAATYLVCWFFLSKSFKVDKEARERFGDMADIAGALIPLAHGFGRIGCFFAGCCYGKSTSAWFGVEMHGEKVVPVQLFEAIFLFMLAGVLLWLVFRDKKEKRFPLLPVYMVVYGIWRFFIEYARGDERGQTIVPFLTPSQLIAVLLVAGGIAYFVIWLIKRKKALAKALNNRKNREES